MRKQRFRVLTTEELADLESEFVHFLILNGIDANRWESMKQEHKEKSEELIGSFSDMIIGGRLESVQFLTLARPHHLAAYHVQKDQIVSIGIRTAEPGIDFSLPKYSQELERADKTLLDVYYATKPVSKEHVDEVFDLISQGCDISDGTDYRNLSMIYAAMSET